MNACSPAFAPPLRRTRHCLATAVAVSLALGMVSPGRADPLDGLQFSEGFLIGGEAIDLQRYAQGNPMAPGVYPLDLVVNGAFRESRDITFVPGEQGAVPCLPVAPRATTCARPTTRRPVRC